MSKEIRTLAYQQGWDAYRQQQGTDTFPTQGQNPYNPNSSDYWDWAVGWNDRCRDDAEDECYWDSYGYK